MFWGIVFGLTFTLIFGLLIWLTVPASFSWIECLIFGLVLTILMVAAEKKLDS